MSDDEAELRALRQSSQYRSFQQAFGRDHKESPRESAKRKLSEVEDSDVLSDHSIPAGIADEDDDLSDSLRDSLPMSFGGGQKYKHRLAMSGINQLHNSDIRMKKNESSSSISSNSDDTGMKSEKISTIISGGNNSAIVRKWDDQNEESHSEIMEILSHGSSYHDPLMLSDLPGSSMIQTQLTPTSSIDNRIKIEHDDSNAEQSSNSPTNLRKFARKFVKKITERLKLPVKFEAKLRGPQRCISSVKPDKSGTRLLVGSYDNTVYLYDFGGMDKTMSHFRELTPQSGYPIVGLDWSPSSSHFLCVTSSPQPLIYDRDGFLITEFVRGDMYIRDLVHTKGHLMGCNGGQWLPTDKHRALTWSGDGSIRLWDISMEKTCLSVLKVQNARGNTVQRMAVNSASISRDGSILVAGCQDGSLQTFDPRRSIAKIPAFKEGTSATPMMSKVNNGGRSLSVLRNAHLAGSEITCVCFDPSNAHLLATRGGIGDDSMKLWDLRKFHKPLKTFDNLPNNFSTTNICFSPDQKLICTGISIEKPLDRKNDVKSAVKCDSSSLKSMKTGSLVKIEEERDGFSMTSSSSSSSSSLSTAISRGSVVFVEKSGADSREVFRMPMTDKAVTSVAWNPRINHLFVGGGDNMTRVLFDDKLSKNGALMCAERKEKKRHIDEQLKFMTIVNPNALAEFRSDFHKKSIRAKIRANREAREKTMPELPVHSIRGSNGKLGTGSFTAHVFKDVAKNVMSKVDPRDALLSWDDRRTEDESTQQWTAVYSVTQPKKVFAQEEPGSGQSRALGLPPPEKKRKTDSSGDSQK